MVFVVGEMGNGKAFVSGLEGGYDSGRQAGPFTTQTSYSTKPAEKYTSLRRQIAEELPDLIEGHQQMVMRIQRGAGLVIEKGAT